MFEVDVSPSTTTKLKPPLGNATKESVSVKDRMVCDCRELSVVGPRPVTSLPMDDVILGGME